MNYPAIADDWLRGPLEQQGCRKQESDDKSQRPLLDSRRQGRLSGRFTLTAKMFRPLGEFHGVSANPDRSPKAERMRLRMHKDELMERLSQFLLPKSNSMP